MYYCIKNLFERENLMKEVKVGIVGLGFMGSTHFRIHSSMPNVKVVALADIDPVKRKGVISSVVGNFGGGDNSQPLDLRLVSSERTSLPGSSVCR